MTYIDKKNIKKYCNLPLQKSARSSINMPVNQLRDPFIFKEKENVYMFYAVKGESGIAISKLIFS